MDWRGSSFFGALLHAIVITFLIEMSKSDTTLSIWFSQQEILVCMSTVVWWWGHTSTTCCGRVMVHWDSLGRLSGLCHHMHWTLSLPVSYTASWTTAMLFFSGLPACDVQCLQSILNTAVHLVAGSSRRDHMTWPPCCETATGFLFSSASSTSCIRLFIVVCMATHRPTW